MLRRIVLALIVVALVGAADASADTKSIKSSVSFQHFDCWNCVAAKGFGFPPNSVFTVGGYVTSAKGACRANRRVKVIAVSSLINQPDSLVDTDRTSDTGWWNVWGAYPLVSLDHFKAELVEKKIGPKGHRRICEGDTATYFLDN